ncbi:MAG: hypothetical protein O7B81_01730, partial [Gammaproteobacteria bacterium]|nr:hypothetical protein [Gammaproteobacteria bacterium]
MHYPSTFIPLQFGTPGNDEPEASLDQPEIKGATAISQRHADHEKCQLLARLAYRMTLKSRDFWPELRGNSNQDDNEIIPAGYTYLAQFVAHDLVSNIAPVPNLDHLPDLAQRDFRSQRLILDTLYGGGPATNPSAFALRQNRNKQRIYMRLGRVSVAERIRDTFNDHESSILVDQPARDIPRTACPFLNDNSSAAFTDALVADPRNDDSLILSQLTAVFHELHNIVVDATVPELRSGDSNLSDLHVYRHFLLTRKIVALVYRNIVVEDLLSRLLDRKIYKRYSKARNNPPAPTVCTTLFGNDHGISRVPVEFSHAVFRFAHAIIRHRYTLNDELESREVVTTIHDILMRTSERNPDKTPLSCDWLVDWKHFFAMEKGFKPNFSRRIRPDVGAGTLATDTHFPNEHSVETGGLFYRDLIRGAEAGMQSVQDLVDKIPEDDRARSNLLVCPNFRRKKIVDWLNAISFYKFNPDELDALSEDPPLYFFTLFEAAHDKSGERLGVLGSTIVAEVMFSALHSTQSIIEDDPLYRRLLSATHGRDSQGLQIVIHHGKLKEVFHGGSNPTS